MLFHMPPDDKFLNMRFKCANFVFYSWVNSLDGNFQCVDPLMYAWKFHTGMRVKLSQWNYDTRSNISFPVSKIYFKYLIVPIDFNNDQKIRVELFAILQSWLSA